MDKVDPKTRSQIMAAVRSKGTRSTERRLRAYLVKAGVRGWQMHKKNILGNPDFIFAENKLAIFVDGCFWHLCPRCCRLPVSRKEYWLEKIKGNKNRDILVSRKLRIAGWKVLRIWEHEIKENPEKIINKIKKALLLLS